MNRDTLPDIINPDNFFSLDTNSQHAILDERISLAIDKPSFINLKEYQTFKNKLLREAHILHLELIEEKQRRDQTALIVDQERIRSALMVVRKKVYEIKDETFQENSEEMLLEWLNHIEEVQETRRNSMGRPPKIAREEYCYEVIKLINSFTSIKITKSKNSTPYNQLMNLALTLCYGENEGRNIQRITTPSINKFKNHNK